jgi:hypothetical protein
MAATPDRQWRFPTRDELRAASPWVWALMVVALAAFFHAVAQGPAQIPLISPALFAMPAVVAAALIYVAPREPLIRIAAFGFAAPIFLDLLQVVMPGILSSTLANRDWTVAAERIIEWTAAIPSVTWVFTCVAVVALAVYVGRVGSRRGWAIVALGAVFAAVLALVSLIQLLSFADLEGIAASGSLPVFVAGMIGNVTLVAWAYLLAVTVERHKRLLAVAAALRLVMPLVGLVPVLALPASVAPNDFSANAFMVFAWISAAIGAVFWVTLVAGIVRELPRRERVAAAGSLRAPEALSVGR